MFEIKENIEIRLNVEVVKDEDGSGFAFRPLCTEDDWASYSLETKDGKLVADHVSYESLEVNDESLLVEWYKGAYPEEYALCDKEDITEDSEEKLNEVFGCPDALYEAHVTDAKHTALTDWLESEEPKIFRDDIRGFGNQFDLTFVLPGAEYEPGEKEYEITPDDAAMQHFMYTDDPTVEDFSSARVIT